MQELRLTCTGEKTKRGSAAYALQQHVTCKDRAVIRFDFVPELYLTLFEHFNECEASELENEILDHCMMQFTVPEAKEMVVWLMDFILENS